MRDKDIKEFIEFLKAGAVASGHISASNIFSNPGAEDEIFDIHEMIKETTPQNGQITISEEGIQALSGYAVTYSDNEILFTFYTCTNSSNLLPKLFSFRIDENNNLIVKRVKGKSNGSTSCGRLLQTDEAEIDERTYNQEGINTIYLRTFHRKRSFPDRFNNHAPSYYDTLDQIDFWKITRLGVDYGSYESGGNLPEKGICQFDECSTRIWLECLDSERLSRPAADGDEKVESFLDWFVKCDDADLAYIKFASEWGFLKDSGYTVGQKSEEEMQVILSEFKMRRSSQVDVQHRPALPGGH